MTPEQFDAHPLWDAVDDALAQLGKTQGGAPAGQRADRRRIQWIGAQVRKFRGADWRHFTAGMLDSVSTIWADVNANASSIPSDRAYLQNALSSAESCLPMIGAWPHPGGRQGGTGKLENEFFENYEKSTEASLAAIIERNESLQTEADERERAHAEQVAALETQLTELQTSIDQHEAQVTSATASMDAKLASVETEASEAQSAREKAFRAWLDEQRKALVDEQAEPMLRSLEESRTRGQDVLGEINELKQSVERVTGKAASAVLARDYGSYANREYVVGVLGYLLGFGFLGWFGWYLLETVGGIERDVAVSWQFVGLKFGLTVTFAGAAAVAFRFGAQALKRAATNKRVELELRAIVPFLEDVSDEDAAQAKLDFITRMFGRAFEEQPRRGDRAGVDEAVGRALSALNRDTGSGSA
ncbi:hypothetical protein [Solicola sp. PLA-1-18]|uniref:hypothetical protein n=1 Tax=Solicola sp. PLA-1-18 TaxID=3380532 RepID=UPI003B7CA7E8